MDPTKQQRILDSRYHEKALQEIVKRNKKCADCLKPSPSFVNLSLNTFVCLECSGLLRDFGFRIKGLGLSTFTPQEVQALDLSGGNKHANEVWLGKHPDGEKATPGWDNLEILRRFLVKKYRERQWYDESAAQRPSEPVRSRTDSVSSAGSGKSSLLDSPSAPQARKRVGSRDGVVRGANAVMGQSSHRSFLAATHARAAAQRHSSANEEEKAGLDGANGDEFDNDEDTAEDSDDSFGDIADPAERERKRKEHIRKRIEAFYKVHNPEKLDSLDLFVEWVMYHGMGAFNKKLREKYGTDIPSERKKDLKTLKEKRKLREKQQQRDQRPIRKELLEQAQQLAALEEAAQALAMQDLASRKRTDSLNPFDDFDHPIQMKTGAPSNPFPSYDTSVNGAAFIPAGGMDANPFEDLMFL